ncbi:uncharacterized protein EURHEDRAFT_381133 [Aspergillus ruber CBS 135680]|uniref:Alpha/beta hydrolase fold-3 domain-containing protein n=1 Tax=Aspergillus ruber (strain CBS 135680) TaxID=1388766 RepID=A0A017S503_ASPRC|nr:uncharacterized protein EURHEDRAFT_381133 [Aspergillus ruber CBS 135680]EYE91265.1 hypothetical protein EURHEDRAFT_381133 [Aspergillus ruber CBS 135680]
MALAKAGVRTKLQQYPGLAHYFWIFFGLEVSKEFISDLIAGTQWMISQMA